MRKLGLRRDEINIILSAVDYNQDGFLDAFELDRLRLLAKQARSTHVNNVREGGPLLPGSRRRRGYRVVVLLMCPLCLSGVRPYHASWGGPPSVQGDMIWGG